MYLTHISLKNFRNFSKLELPLHSGVNLFVGKNGQGKTNLLESIYLILRGTSFREGKAEVWLKKFGDEISLNAKISAQISKNNLRSDLVMEIQPHKRKLLLDNKQVPAKNVSIKYPSILFSPESLSALKEGPEVRRQLIDEFLLVHHFENIKAVTEFKKALQMRNGLLRDYKRGIYEEYQIQLLLDALDEIYLKTAVVLSHKRINAINNLIPFWKMAVSNIAPQEFVDISVDYSISSFIANNWSYDNLYEKMYNRLKILRKNELSFGSSLVGPHKHEIKFRCNGNDARYFCSQGQQRTLILGFKMAQIMYHYHTFQVHPLLLLDDVLSELDSVKCANFLRFIETIRSQIILTSTDISFPFDFSSKGRTIFRIYEGQAETLAS
ncbi:MAG: DNA replication and repair protein RecF [Bdellovibrionales bacterium]|nr:DNA replication and repair protein RecF [Bdellovibrionales bacterium]